MVSVEAFVFFLSVVFLRMHLIALKSIASQRAQRCHPNRICSLNKLDAHDFESQFPSVRHSFRVGVSDEVARIAPGAKRFPR